MAETMAFALVGALILTLTLIPVLASFWFKKGVNEHRNRAFEWMKEKYACAARLGARSSQNCPRDCGPDLRRNAAAGSFYRRRVHAAPR